MAFDDHAINRVESARLSIRGNPGDALLRQFGSVMGILGDQAASVLVAARKTATALDALEGRLVAVHTLCLEESVVTRTALDDILSELWTRLGGNRAKVQRLEERRIVLQRVDQYRRSAVGHIAATMHTLTAVEEELSELRDKLSASEIAGTHVPVEVQIASIARSVERLRARRRPQVSGPKVAEGPWLIGR